MDITSRINFYLCIKSTTSTLGNFAIIVLYIAEIKFARKKKLLDNLLTKYLQNFKYV